MITILTPVPLNRGSTDGFSPRYLAFAQALAEAERQVVTIGPQARFDAFPSEVEVTQHIEAHLTPPAGAGQVIRHIVRADRPYRCFPRSVGPSSLGDGVLVGCLAHAADLALTAPRKLFLLEERHRSPRAQGRAGHLFARAEERKWRRLYRDVSRSRAPVVSISRTDRDYFAEFIDPAQIEVIPHGIDLRYWAPQPEEVERDIDVLFVGNMSPGRHPDLPETVREILQRRRGTRIVLVGSHPPAYVEALEREGVELLRFVDDVRPLYQRARLALVPTAQEAVTKTTVFQAWAMRVPVVTGTSVLRESSATTAEWRLAGDHPAAMADAVVAALSAPSLREEVAELGAQRVSANHDLRQTAAMFKSAVERFGP